MNRRIWIAGVAAAALAAAIAILLIKFGGGPEDEAALELDGIESQTPVQNDRAPAEETQETSDDSDAAAESQGKAETAAAGGKYDFKTWEEALDRYAELVGLEYDQLDGTKVFSSPEDRLFLARS